VSIAREARVSERKAAKLAAKIREAAEQEAREAEAAEQAAREIVLEAERKAARDARYAARKGPRSWFSVSVPVRQRKWMWRKLTPAS
jgi:hypothetical protein